MEQIKQFKTPVLYPHKDAQWFDTKWIMDVYPACTYGCIYCKQGKAQLQTDFLKNILEKQNPIQQLQTDLKSIKETGMIAVGKQTDSYPELEQTTQYTRQALQIISQYEFGVVLATKSTLFTRDIDVLQKIKQKAPVVCAVSITTCSAELAKKIEPNAPAPLERLRALKEAAKAGINTGVLMMPVLPFLEDSEENICEIIYSAAQSGAKFIYPMFGIYLSQEQRAYYYEKLTQLFPNSAYAQAYEQRYATRPKCFVPGVQSLTEIFKKQAEQNFLQYEMKQIVNMYQRGYDSKQLTFL